MPSKAKAYIAVVTAAGSAVLIAALALWSTPNWRQLAVFVGLAALASTLKVRMPGVETTVSPNFVFVLLGMAALDFSQAVLISFVAALVQVLWASAKRAKLVQVAFSAGALMVSAAAAYSVSHLLVGEKTTESTIALILLAGTVYFPLNSALVSTVISLVEGKPLKPLFVRCYQWTFAYFMVGIVVAGLLSGGYARSSMWKGALVAFPAMVLAYAYFVSRTRVQPAPALGLLVEEEEPVEVHS